MIMLLNDIVIVVLYASVLISSWKYVNRARITIDDLPDDQTIRRHFKVHTFSVIGFMIFAALGLLFSVLHLLSQNLFEHIGILSNIASNTVLEIGGDIALAGILLSAKSYIHHAIDEEHLDNEFYIGKK